MYPSLVWGKYVLNIVLLYSLQSAFRKTPHWKAEVLLRKISSCKTLGYLSWFSFFNKDTVNLFITHKR